MFTSHSESYTLKSNRVYPNFIKKEKETATETTKKKKSAKPAASTSKQSLRIHSMDCNNLEIDFTGFHFSLVNAYRRIVLAEVATMAIEKVYMYKNSSIVQDEVLSHRLGLVPLSVPPHLFNFRESEDENFTDENCVMYQLRVKARDKSSTAKPGADDVNTITIDKLVTSEHLRWVPIGNQKQMFQGVPVAPLREEVSLPKGVKPGNTDLVLAKLKPGQRILLEAYAFKGIGSDHAKFQPGLCWYRMMPEITITKPVLNANARLLQRCFSPGVIAVTTNSDGDEEASVQDPRYDSCSRNVFKYEQFEDSVVIARDATQIIFSIESHSAMKSFEILEAAVTVMIEKCDNLLSQLCNVEDE